MLYVLDHIGTVRASLKVLEVFFLSDTQMANGHIFDSPPSKISFFLRKSIFLLKLLNTVTLKIPSALENKQKHVYTLSVQISVSPKLDGNFFQIQNI